MLHKIYRFRSKVDVYSELGSFVIKTVQHTDELLEALRLRYQIFHREMKGVEKPRGIDMDEYDFKCDHLIIIDRSTKKIVGTYRLNCSLFSDSFYSEREFHIGNIHKTPGVKLELGRAGIDKDYRRGAVIALLWRGIGEYMAKTQAQVLFGCASILTREARVAALIHRYLEEKGLLRENYFCPPTEKYSMPMLDLWMRKIRSPLSVEEVSEVEEILPPLCRAYIKAGALFGGEPAWDEEYRCIDFLTILPRELLNMSLGRKYNICQTEMSQAATS